MFPLFLKNIDSLFFKWGLFVNVKENDKVSDSKLNEYYAFMLGFNIWIR